MVPGVEMSRPVTGSLPIPDCRALSSYGHPPQPAAAAAWPLQNTGAGTAADFFAAVAAAPHPGLVGMLLF